MDTKSSAEISFLLESKANDGLKSLFVKFPKGYMGEIETDGSVLHSVVIMGELHYEMPQNNEEKVLDVGSYFGSTDESTHTIVNKGEEYVVVYVRTNGKIQVK